MVLQLGLKSNAATHSGMSWTFRKYCAQTRAIFWVKPITSKLNVVPVYCGWNTLRSLKGFWFLWKVPVIPCWAPSTQAPAQILHYHKISQMKISSFLCIYMYILPNHKTGKLMTLYFMFVEALLAFLKQFLSCLKLSLCFFLPSFPFLPGIVWGQVAEHTPPSISHLTVLKYCLYFILKL